jgi:site-specific recombinase XerD
LDVFIMRFHGAPLDAITSPQIRQHIVELRRRDCRYAGAPQRPELAGGVSDETIQAHIRALRGFWAWCLAEYRLTFNPMTNIKHPKRRNPQPKAITPGDAAALIAATGNDVNGIRDRAILAFLLDTGCRAQTIMKLDMTQLDIQGRRAIVEEKGRPARVMPFIERTAELLAAWLAVRPAAAKTVFCGLAPHTYGKPMTSTSLHGMLRRLKKKAGVTGRVNPHSFRHGFAREYLKNGGDLATLARLMGHTDVKITSEYYAVFSENELADTHDKFSPLQNLKSSKPPDDSERK